MDFQKCPEESHGRANSEKSRDVQAVNKGESVLFSLLQETNSAISNEEAKKTIINMKRVVLCFRLYEGRCVF